ncbi:myosin ATPase [Sarracenia purpurea var. burkii]
MELFIILHCILDASPIPIGGRHAFVEEKRSTNSRGKLGFMLKLFSFEIGDMDSGMTGLEDVQTMGMAEATHGVISMAGTEFGNNRGSNRGGFSNRGADGYQRADSIGSNITHGGGMVINGTAKTVAPRVSAAA